MAKNIFKMALERDESNFLANGLIRNRKLNDSINAKLMDEKMTKRELA